VTPEPPLEQAVPGPSAELLPLPRRLLQPSGLELQAKLSMLMDQMTALKAQVDQLEKHAADSATGSAAAPQKLMALPGWVPREADLKWKQPEGAVPEGDAQSTTESESEDAEACVQKEPRELSNQKEVEEAKGDFPADAPEMEAKGDFPADAPEMEEPWSPPSPTDDAVECTKAPSPLEFPVFPRPRPGLLCPGYRASGLLRVYFEAEPVSTIEVPKTPLEEFWAHPRRGEVVCALCELLVLENDTFVTELYLSELPRASGLDQPSYNDLVCSQCLKEHMIPPERISNTPGRGSIGWLKVDNCLSSPRNDVETSSPELAADSMKAIDVQSDGGLTETEMDSDEEQQRRAQVLLDSL